MAFLAAALPAIGAAGATAAGTATAGAAASGAATLSMGSGILGSLTLGKALLYGGTLLQGLGQIGSAQSEAAAMESQAEAALYNAKERARTFKEAGYKLSKERRQTIGTQAAISGASGVQMTGSPLDVLAQTAAEYESDIKNYGYSAQSALTAGGYEAQMLKGLAKSKRGAGFLGAGSTILTGYGRSLLGDYL